MIRASSLPPTQNAARFSGVGSNTIFLDDLKEDAIAALVQLLQSTNLHEHTHWQVGLRLTEIKAGNENAIAILLKFC